MGNADIRNFKEKIVNVVNNSQLPIEVKRLVFVEVLGHITEASNKIIIQELNEIKNSNMEKSEE